MGPSSSDEWPDYLGSPREIVFAMGVIAVTYNKLESVFSHLFVTATNLKYEQAKAVFWRLPNDKRTNSFKEMYRFRGLGPEYTERLDFFCKAYDVCADNRNDLMHASMPHDSRENGAEPEIIKMFKRTKSGGTSSWNASLETLKIVADEMQSVATFGNSLVMKIPNTSNLVLLILGRNDGDALPDIPSLPRTLLTLSPPAPQ